MKFRNGIIAYWFCFGISLYPLFFYQHFLWILGLFIFSGVLFFIPTLIPNDSLFGKITTHFTTQQQEVWLTIDDGPHPESTPQILDLLDHYQARATFFVIGREAQKYPRLIQEIVRRGHELGNHTQNHPSSLFWILGPTALEREVKNCQKILEEIVPHAVPQLFRAPVGMVNIFLHPILQKENLRLIGWSARGYDAILNDSEQIFQKIKKSLSPGKIILVHEGKPYARFPKNNNPLKILLLHLKKEGYRCVTPWQNHLNNKMDF